MPNKNIKVLVDTSPLDTLHAIRGIGTYTRFLVETLTHRKDVTLYRSGQEKSAEFTPDLVHYPYFDLFFSTLPMVRSKPTVVTIHDVIPLIFPAYYPPGIKGKARYIKQKFALQTVEAIITDSQASKQDIQKHLGVPEKKIHVVYLAANPEIKKPDDVIINRVRREYHLPKNYILYVGDINYNKNIPQLIKAARSLDRHIKLVCVGKNFKSQNIPEWQWIETQLALSDVEDKVRFIPDIQGNASEELSAIYSEALCYVQPSLYEGFGLPVLEAMQCFTPVVSTHNSSLTEVGGEEVVYVDSDAESITEGINEVLGWSKAKRQERTRAAYNWSQQFSWTKAAAQTVTVYRQVIA